MSAREKLVQTLVNSMAVTRLGRLDGIRREAESLVAEALDEHATELAEKVRASRLEVPDGFIDRQSWRYAWEDGRDDAADLIDPEVSE